MKLSWPRLWRVFFSCLSLLLALTFLHYGMSWDEPHSAMQGRHVYHWYTSLFTDQTMFSWDYHYYGGFYNLISLLLSMISPLHFVETHHLLNALCGLGSIFVVYKLGARLAGPRAGFLSAIFLTAIPGYYGHMPINPKDIPFAFFYALAFYVIIKSGDDFPKIRPKTATALIAAISTAIGVRIGGVILLAQLPLYWTLLAWARDCRWSFAPIISVIKYVLPIAFLSLAVAVIWWPYLQSSPIRHFFEILGKNNHWSPDYVIATFFEGTYWKIQDLPRRYLFKRLSFSLPEYIFIAALAGIGALAQRCRKKIEEHPWEFSAAMVLIASSIFIPFFSILVTGTIVYDGIRHVLFMLPFIALLAGLGTDAFLKGPFSPFAKRCVTVGVAASLVLTAIDMIQLYPYEYIYVNRLFAGGLKKSAQRYDTDYWCTAHKEAIEWVIKNIPASADRPVRIANCANQDLFSYYLNVPNYFSETSREKAGVFLATTRWHCYQRVSGKILHVIERQGTPLLYIYGTDH